MWFSVTAVDLAIQCLCDRQKVLWKCHECNLKNFASVTFFLQNLKSAFNTDFFSWHARPWSLSSLSTSLPMQPHAVIHWGEPNRVVQGTVYESLAFTPTPFPFSWSLSSIRLLLWLVAFDSTVQQSEYHIEYIGRMNHRK